MTSSVGHRWLFVESARAPSIVLAMALSACSSDASAPAAAPETTVAIPYERRTPGALAPFPDDLLLRDGSLRAPDYIAADDIRPLFDSIIAGADGPAGWSPVQPFVIPLPGPIDQSSLPADPRASRRPTSPLLLLDLDRLDDPLPVDIWVDDDPDAPALYGFPATALAPGGRYALILTRALRLADGRFLGPSDFMARALDPAASPEAPVATLQADLDGIFSSGSLALGREDVALALFRTVRRFDERPPDGRVFAEQLRASPPPEWTVDDVQLGFTDSSPLGALVTGQWTFPSFREDDRVARDDLGQPRIAGTETVGFTLALPKPGAPAPLLMFQHGSPGNAETGVIDEAVQWAAEAGFAVIGFTDINNRESPGQDSVLSLLQRVLETGRIPETEAALPLAEQLAFLRLLPELDTLDVAPADGAPDLDLNRPLTYVGRSFGAIRGVGLLPHAPEIQGAALAVGGGHQSARLVWQAFTSPLGTELVPVVQALIPSATRRDIVTGISLLQLGFDEQEWLLEATRTDAPVEGQNVLLVEGLADSFLPPVSLGASAAALGLRHVGTVYRDTGHLDAAPGNGPGGNTTRGFYQFVPASVNGLTAAPSCAADGVTDGHFCAQSGAEAVAQRRRFLLDVVEGRAPTILSLDPSL
ncbi:MAG: hypothetical protein AAF715_13335 [Myxococcota bacterium]